MADARVAEIVDSVTAPEAMPAPTTAPGPAYYPAYGAAPTAPRVEMGIFATIAESIFGQPDPDTWRPLPLSTLFSEGWNEAWVPSPNGSGGAPRQGWINARTATFTGCGSSRSLRGSTEARRATATSAPTRSSRR